MLGKFFFHYLIDNGLDKLGGFLRIRSDLISLIRLIRCLLPISKALPVSINTSHSVQSSHTTDQTFLFLP